MYVIVKRYSFTVGEVIYVVLRRNLSDRRPIVVPHTAPRAHDEVNLMCADGKLIALRSTDGVYCRL
jgi:hypothetical protein